MFPAASGSKKAQDNDGENDNEEHHETIFGKQK
jgi:hypothetical protein